MATHSSTFAWKIPWMEEPGRLKSMGSLRVGHDGRTSLSLFTSMHWRKKWQPTPVFLPGASQGQRSLVGCRLWGRTESDTTEATQQQQQQPSFSYTYRVQVPFYNYFFTILLLPHNIPTTQVFYTSLNTHIVFYLSDFPLLVMISLSFPNGWIKPLIFS